MKSIFKILSCIFVILLKSIFMLSVFKLLFKIILHNTAVLL